MSLRSVFLSTFFLIPLSIFAHITGLYEVSGFDPDTKQNYTGSLEITFEGEVYLAKWTFGSTIDTGTGVKKGGSLSIVFNEGNSNSFGTQLYEIKSHSLKGPWARYGHESKGFEKAKKIRCAR